jgi:hypothetical protein
VGVVARGTVPLCEKARDRRVPCTWRPEPPNGHSIDQFLYVFDPFLFFKNMVGVLSFIRIIDLQITNTKLK